MSEIKSCENCRDRTTCKLFPTGKWCTGWIFEYIKTQTTPQPLPEVKTEIPNAVKDLPFTLIKNQREGKTEPVCEWTKKNEERLGSMVTVYHPACKNVTEYDITPYCRWCGKKIQERL